ncbi:unnamed protein product [Orchesella dallaii]|uniref:Serine-threonine/tyrosine-protein kinase catalytic domain-containing protein n=1 Tax=Orchesella dallaii TaxID=48710 RepID=A0ABP1RPK2_9HEXA
MKRFLIVAFLHHIWVASVVTQSKNQLSRVGKAEVPNLSSQFFDLTDLIRGLLQDKISDENFNSHLKLIFANETSLRNNSNVLSITGLYDTGCIMLDNCKTKITEVIATVKNAIGERIDMILILSVRLDIYNKSYHEEKENSLKIENVTDFKYLFLFQLPEEIECDNMEDMDPSAWKNMLGPKNGNWRNQMGASEFYGFGYDERLIGCYEVKTAISLAGFTVVYISFGKTAGVPETFGVFQNQIGSLYRQNKEFIKNIPVLSTFYINSLKRTFYFPKSESLGDSRHQHLLREYGSRWLAESNNDTGLILPIPENTTDMDDAKFSVIPYLGPSNGWVFPSALLAITQEFSSMIFSHSHLKAFYENAAGLYQNLNKKPSNDFRLEAILDYSYRWTLDKNVNTWEALELVLNQWRWQSVVYPLKNIVLKTLLFKIGYTEAGNFQAFVDIDFASHIVHNYQIGCNISVKVFSQVSPSTVVEVCKNISGSLYILNSEVVLGNISEMGTGYNYHYPNIIRKQLEHIKSIRNDILIQHPNATVYLTLSLLSNYPEDEDNTVALNNNWRNIVAAIKNLATRGLVEPTKEIFFTFPPIFGEGLDIHRQLEPSIVREFIEKIVEEKLPNAMGIHIDVSTSLMNMIENKKLSEPYHDMELWKSLRRDGNPKFNLEMGILLNQHACMATLKYMAFGEISDNFMRLMNATNYIVYSDKLNLAAEDNVKSLAAIFDTHFTPFGGLAWSPNCANLVQEGLRLVAPQFASEIIYMRMQECWSLDPVKRPAFAELSEFFRGLCNDQQLRLDDRYAVELDIIRGVGGNDSIVLSFDVKTTGFIGFAIGRGPSLFGADIFIGGVYSNLGVYGKDYYGHEPGGYVLDQRIGCQNWNVLFGKETDGGTTLTTTGLLNTGDTIFDIEIEVLAIYNIY